MQKHVPVMSLQPVVARVQHVGKCGLHTANKGSDIGSKCAAAVQAWCVRLPVHGNTALCTPCLCSLYLLTMRLSTLPFAHMQCVCMYVCL